MAVGTLLWPLFGLSVGALAYAHHKVWVRKIGPRASTVILLVNTALVTLLWVWRLA